MEKHHQCDGRERIPRRRDVTILEQRRVFQQLHGRAGDDRPIAVLRIQCLPQGRHKFLLVVVLPDIFFGVDLQQKFSIYAHKPVAQGRWQIRNP